MLSIMKTDASLSVPGDVLAYVQLQQQMHEALREQHPEWVDSHAGARLAKFMSRGSHNCSVFPSRTNTGLLPNRFK
jgi:hypothetical protein